MDEVFLSKQESMRVCPSVPMINREAEEDFVYRKYENFYSLRMNSFFIGGQTIRKGTIVYIFISAIHHDANVFPDPDKFDPDRFSESVMASEDRSPFAYIPFSAGSRNCIGQYTIAFLSFEKRRSFVVLLHRATLCWT